MSLGSELRALRVEAGLSQRVMAERAGCSHHYITELERGTRGWKPALDLLERLAAAVDAKPDVFRIYRHQVACTRWPDQVDKLYYKLNAGSGDA